MNIPQQIAQQLRDVHFGGNWTGVNLREVLADVNWQQATRQISSFHSIATLVYHLNYYVRATIKFLEHGKLDAHDRYSFQLTPIATEDDWTSLLNQTWHDAEQLASLIEALPATQLSDTFADAKYGTYFRCLTGPIEHCHYHLGQISLIKAMLTV